MHYLVRIITAAETKESAHERAIAYADELVENQHFDYYAEQGRWRESGRTYRLASALGKKAVESAMQANRDEFNASMHAARLMLAEFTDDQIYEGQFGTNEDVLKRDYFASRWQFTRISPDEGYLYADRGIWGEQITNETDYANATKERTDLWVTSLDFHR